MHLNANAEVMIGFIHQIYNVSEDDGKVCVVIGVISGILGRNVTVQLAFSSESAVCESLANYHLTHTVNAEHVNIIIIRWQRFWRYPWFTDIHL